MNDMDEADKIQLAELRKDVQTLLRYFDDLSKKFTTYATVEALEGVKGKVRVLENITFGAISIVLISIIGAVIALVVKK